MVSAPRTPGGEPDVGVTARPLSILCPFEGWRYAEIPRLQHSSLALGRISQLYHIPESGHAASRP
jgi:hypothetical protein